MKEKKIVQSTSNVTYNTVKVDWVDNKKNVFIWNPKHYSKQQGIATLLRRFFNSLNESENVFPFDYIIENANLCHNMKGINIILSAPGDVASRDRIRLMWGNPAWSFTTGVKVAFILGASRHPKVNKAVLKENVMHKDLIQVNFKDSYDNLTLKSLSIIHWAKHNCENTEWIIKSDTDVFINVFILPR